MFAITDEWSRLWSEDISTDVIKGAYISWMCKLCISHIIGSWLYGMITLFPYGRFPHQNCDFGNRWHFFLISHAKFQAHESKIVVNYKENRLLTPSTILWANCTCMQTFAKKYYGSVSIRLELNYCILLFKIEYSIWNVLFKRWSYQSGDTHRIPITNTNYF